MATSISWCLLVVFIAKTQCAVLDPALYLSPSPPMSPSTSNTETNFLSHPGQMDVRMMRHVNTNRPKPKEDTRSTNPKTDEESMETAATFWPRISSIDHGLRSIHIPVTFSISGTYGGYGGGGVIGNSYAKLVGGTTNIFGSYGKPGLAGSGYESLGTGLRIYGGSNGPSWTGWGNGKWGHYGKG